MNLDKYSVFELNNIECELLYGGTWVSWGLGFLAKSYSILGSRANDIWLSSEGDATRQALQDFQ